MKLTKTLASVFSTAILLSASVLPLFAQHAAALGTNLVANPSAETASGTAPTGWSQDTWGTNTHTFTYATTGHTGSKSLETKITKYTSGDSKWAFTPVAITGSTAYTYSDFYKSGIATTVTAEFDNGSGTLTYQDLGTAAAATGWTQFSVNFTAPATAKKVTIYHYIAGVGTLDIDDVSLATADTTTTPVTPVTPVTPTPGNELITNGGFETASGSLPTGWSQDTWGTNTHTFTYATTGHTGSRSGTVKITKYTSGDSKWAFTPVAVTAGAQYTFSDYYQSTVKSDVVAEYNDGSGNFTYVDLGTPAAATAWTKFTATLTAPANAKQVTVYHVIAAVGTLSIDDASLVGTSTTTTPVTPVTPVTPTAANVVPNPSLETASTTDTTTPNGWYKGQYGNNTTTFTYATTGHTGSRSGTINTTAYTDGGANWTYSPQAITAGKEYKFSDYYQSTVSTEVLVAVTMNDGTTQYIWLGNPAVSNGSWTRFYATFTMPTGAVSAVAYQTLAAVGTLTVDDFDLEPYVAAGFNAPLVSITFDDSIASQYNNALPVLNQDGFKATFYVISGYLNLCDPDVSSICYMTSQNVKDLYAQGMEIGSHTVDHPHLTQLTAAQVASELADSKTALQNLIGSTITDFAAPYGEVNAAVTSQIQSNYGSQRGVEIGYNDKDNFDKYNLLVQDINSSTTVAQVKSYIDQAKASNTWLILMYHDINVDDTTDPGYNTTPTDFATEMAYLKASGVSVQTLAQGLVTTSAQISQ
ncbi:MAG: hypothetical protein JWN38_519 [Candidatus Saccharibacteria bacterium]|nr:hypothetical protein [Candidatus Saccharibacteria bacterium]